MVDKILKNHKYQYDKKQLPGRICLLEVSLRSEVYVVVSRIPGKEHVGGKIRLFEAIVPRVLPEQFALHHKLNKSVKIKQ